MARPVRDSRALVAWFVDNEMGYDDLHRYVWSPHCSSALVEFLRARHGGIATVNQRWGTDYADFAALAAARPEPVVDRGAMYEDFVAFEREIVKRFVEVSLQATRAADPHHLIASNRHNVGGLSVWMRHIDLCSSYDLVAVNLYPRHEAPGLGPTLRSVLDEVAARTGRPIVMGEWSVAAIDSGLYEEKKARLDWSYVQALPTQTMRARQAAWITADLYNHPAVVGAHWFTYQDIDSAAREANRGLVRSDGRPWEELVGELTGVHRQIEAHLRTPQ